MKNEIVFFALILLCAVLQSCSRTTGREFRDIETYVSDRPDSALTVLEGIVPRTAAQRAHHALLMSIALDKSYIDITDDSIARVAVNWYDRRGPADKKMKAWYYLGLVQRHAGRYTESIISLERALNENASTGNMLYKGLILRAIAENYYSDCNASSSIENCLMAIDVFEEGRDTLYADYERLSLSIYYSFADQFEACDSVLMALLQYPSSRLTPSLRSRVYLRFASSYMSRGNDRADEAVQLFSAYRKMNKTDVPKSELMRLANAFRLTGQIDSAPSCADRFYSQMSSWADSVKWYDYHYRAASAFQNYKEADYYLKQAVTFQNKVVNQSLQQSVETAKSNHYQVLSLEKQWNVEKRNRQIILLLVLFLFLLFAMASLYYQKQKALELEIVAHHELLGQLKDREDAVVTLIKGRIGVLSHLLDQYEQ